MKRLIILTLFLILIRAFSEGYLIDARGIIYKSEKENCVPINKINNIGKILKFHYISQNKYFIATEDQLFVTLDSFKHIASFDVKNISKFTLSNDELKPVFPQINDVDINDTKIAIISYNTIYLGDLENKNFISKKLPDLYFFSVKIFHDNIYVGSSKNGVLKFDLNLKTYHRLFKGFYSNRYSQKVYFFEEVSSLFRTHDKLYSALNFGLNIFELKENNWSEITNFYDNEKVDRLYITKDFITVVNKNENTILLNTGSLVKKIPVKFPENKDFLYGIYFENGYIYERSRKNDIKRSNEKFYGVYIPEKKIKSFVNNLQKFKDMGFNGVVFPLKTDEGNILFKPKDKIFYETKAYRYNKNWKRILKTLHKNGFTVVARIVCFKDEVLFKYMNGKYAFWDEKNMKPWQGKPSEYWVDPNSSFVRKYILEIIKEVEKIGFDEIQLDYIRFPTDGDQEDRVSKYQIDSIEKEEVINYFLKSIKKIVKVPLSIDVYGLQGWYSYPGPQGQNISLFSPNIDTLSPMLYPSHFDKRFFADPDPKRRAYNIIYYGTLRNVKKYPKLNIRPYIQAFTYGAKDYNDEYLMDEIKAVKDANVNQFIFWGLQFKEIDLNIGDGS